MRIAIVTETWPPEVNGVALTVQGLVAQLGAQGHQIDLIRPRPGDRQAAPTPSAAVTPWLDELLVGGAALPRYPGLRIGLPAGGALRERWTRARPDALYVATEGPLGWSALKVAQSLGIASATGFHTRFDDFAKHYGAAWLTPLVFAWLRRFHNHAQATLVATEELLEFLRARGFSQVLKLARGVDTAQFSPAHRDSQLRARWGVDDAGLVVVHVGRLAPEKNLGLLFRAFRAVQTRQPAAKLVVVGDGPSKGAFASANPDVIFTGTLRNQELARHFASGDLFVFPSLTETFGNVTLEAMASGVPVVAFDYGAAREHLRHRTDGMAVAVGNDDALIEATQALADLASVRRAMGAAACARVAPLNPARVAADLAGLLASLKAPRKAA